MRRRLLPALALVLIAQPAFSADSMGPRALRVKLHGLTSEGLIPPEYAFCRPGGRDRTRDGGNTSPPLSWRAGPEETRSYAVIMHDSDVPHRFDDANQEGKTLPKDMPRQDFVHWVLVDIPDHVTRLPEGADSDRMQAEGKRTQKTRYGVRGLNDYGSFMQGTFYGYDGPCPPWNDERLHRYTFTVYALDVPSLKLKGPFTRKEALDAMEGHILAKGEAVGTYSQNPALLKSLTRRAE